jgi:hypothetical protein
VVAAPVDRLDLRPDTHSPDVVYSALAVLGENRMRNRRIKSADEFGLAVRLSVACSLHIDAVAAGIDPLDRSAHG